MINLDPALLDQEKIRKEKRRKMLRRSLLPMALLGVVAVFFLSTWIYNLVYVVSYENNSYPIARAFTETRFVLNVLEPYIADYNQGTASLRMSNYEDAETSFSESLKKSPPEDKLCMVYVNLSLSIEMQGVAAYGNKDYNKAISLYTKAESVLYNNNCASKDEDSSSGKDERAEEAKERLQKSRKDAIDRMNNTTTGNENPDPRATPEEKIVDEKKMNDIRYKATPIGETRDSSSSYRNRLPKCSYQYIGGEEYKCR